ncbi:MAG: carbohydrate ABC transporter permease [Phototrophicaceae bacterium]
MGAIGKFLGRTHGKRGPDWADYVTYLYLILGTVLMFGPVMWLVTSSFKQQSDLLRFPPRLLPYRQEMVEVSGYDEPLPLYVVVFEDGTTRELARVRRVGIEGHHVDPANPEEIIKVNINQTTPVEQVVFSFDNYIRGIERFNFLRYFVNTVTVTAVATALTLLVNSMAAFALSKYQFRGRNSIFVLMISTLLVPLSVILIPLLLTIRSVGWFDSLIGVIIPSIATPTGVFLQRQYMLTIPDELLESARLDGASEWRIYLQVILPLARPALAVLAIFSVMWRWNDFLWPLIVLQSSEYKTLQVGLSSFSGELQTQWDTLLAMTVLTLLPVTVVFAFLQKYITTGIATTGMK